MAVRRNGLYYDPALASAFDNLAEAFKTPSGTDVYGYSRANAERDKAARLSDFFNYMKGTNYDQATADRLGVGAGAYTPDQSYYAVDQSNDTTLKTNAATNATTLDRARIDNAGALARLYATPVVVSDGQTAYLPAQTAEATGLPSMFRGNITVNQGQTARTPTGEVVAGAPKPLTDSEVKGAILGTLPQGDQRAVAMQGVGTTNVLDAKGEATVAFTPDAAGKTPYMPDTTTRQLGTYKTGAGEGNAYFDRDKNTWIDTNTQAPLPPGVPVKSIAPGTNVSIETKAPSKIEDAYGEGIGGQIKATIDNAGNAPRALAEIAQFRDALTRAGDNITTGPLSSYVLKGKQAIGGLIGSNLEGVPEAELINNIGYKLATQASRAISSRPTQFEFAQALATKPGLALSKPGMQAMLNIMEQNAKDDQALATLANEPANRQNWTATVQKYYAEHPVMSPFDPSKPLGAADIAQLEASAQAPATAPAAAAAPSGGKPAVVTQNGHTYMLQPDGSYK